MTRDDIREALEDAAGFSHEQAIVETRECDTEIKRDGEYMDVSGIEYTIHPPCNVRDAFEYIEERPDASVLTASVDDSGHLLVFVPKEDREGVLFQ